MTDRADPCWAAAAGLSPAVRAALALGPPRPPEPLAHALTADLPPVQLPQTPATDLSPRELHALAAACGPDVCLIDCPPNTDRPAFAAAVAVEAVRRGERVAIVTGSPADADAVLARLLDAGHVVGRACGPADTPDPEHGVVAHVHEVEALRRRLVEQLDHRRTDQLAAKSAAAALPRLAELADELMRLGQDTGVKVETAAPSSPAKSGGLLGAVKGWFTKSEPPRTADATSASELPQKQADALDRFRAAARPLTVAGHPVPTPAGLSAASEAVIRAEAAANEAVATAETALSAFDADRPTIERALCRAVPVAVGPSTALSDPLLAAADRVVVLAADGLDDATLERVAALAPARVLMGAAELPHRPHRNGKSGSFLRPTLFRRLWDHLAPPEVWTADGVQLVAALRPHDPAATRDEPLADRPEVELRFSPAGELVAVAFPPTMTLAEAKGLLAAELGFITLATCGGVVWHDDPDRLAACWPATDADSGEWVELGDGVRELVCGCGPDGLTASVSFDRGCGWTREAAERWLAERMPAGRAARLPAPVLVAG